PRDHAAFLADRRGGGGEHDPADARPSGGFDDVSSALDVRSNHRHGVGLAQSDHSRAVERGVAPAQGAGQPVAVEDVAANGSGAQARDGLRGPLGAHQGDRLASLHRQPAEHGRSDETRSAGDEDAPGHRAHRRGEPVMLPENLARYSTADRTVTAAAASMAHWSGKSGPSGSGVRKIAMRIAKNCTFVFALPHTEGRITVPSTATTPRSPMISSSRATMIVAIHGEARPAPTSATSTPETRSLSAVVSRKLPSVVAARHRRARNPSRKSVAAAIPNSPAATP